MIKKSEVYQKEQEKLKKLFENIEENKTRLVDGLIDDAAFLFAQNIELKQILDKTGMVKVNPKNKDMQKTVPAAAQYLKNVNSYANVIKALNAILSKGIMEEDDGLDEYT